MGSRKLFLLLCILAVAPFNGFAQEDDGILRLKLTKIKLLEQTQQLDKAFAIMKELRLQHPDNADVLSSEADLFMSSGYYRNSIASIDEAIAKAPDDENLRKHKRAILLINAPYVSVDQQIVMAGGISLEQKSTFVGKVKYAPFSSMGIEIENNHFRVSSVTRPDGRSQRMSGDKQMGKIFLEHDYANGNSSGISLYAGEDTIGLGGKYDWLDKMGQTSAELILQKPNWDYIQGLTDRGVKDRLSISRTQRLLARTKAMINLAANRYGLDGDNNLASSVSTTVNINYSLPTYNFMQKFLGNNLFVGFDYNIDGEYTLDKEIRFNIEGAEFYPVPIASREVHTLNFFIDKEFSFKTRMQLFGGFSADRLGDEGPSYGTSVIYKPKDNIELEIKASRSISTKKSSASDNTQDQIGIRLKWLF